MKTIQRPLCLGLACLLFIQSSLVRAEAVDDKFTQISPQSKGGGDAFIHGAGYGKILMRIMIMGAVHQQGIHYVPEGTDLFFAILYAGGAGEHTKLNGISIRRRGVQNLIEVALEDLMEAGEAIPKLMDGDVITVPYNWRRSYQEFLFYMSVFTTLSTLMIGIAALTK